MNLAVPKQLNYADVLPVAIESRSNKRTFEPTNGTKFSPSGTNVIRLNLNSDNLADFTHSYLQATITNTATNAAANLALDTGIPWIQKVQIMSGGQELETIDAYNRLHSMLQSVQGNPEQAGEFSLTQKEHFASAITPTASVAAVAITAQQQPRVMLSPLSRSSHLQQTSLLQAAPATPTRQTPPRPQLSQSTTP